MARALLRRSKIIIMDEVRHIMFDQLIFHLSLHHSKATASVDFETDAKVQRATRHPRTKTLTGHIVSRSKTQFGRSSRTRWS